MQKRGNANNVHQRKTRGVILPLLAVLLVALLGVLGIVMLQNYALLMQTQLQAAADAAAHAGAATLCSSQQCWNEVPTVVKNTLAQLDAVGGRASSSLDLASITPQEPSDEDVFVWDAVAEKNLRVTIERGRWLRDSEFEAYGKKWQALHPAKPAFVASNAVRITIERPENLIPTFVLRSNTTFKATSTAIAAPIESQCAAPFAIPACALVTPSGEFQGTGMCKGDRFFTQASHYCPDGNPDCGAYPWQPYGPCKQEWTEVCPEGVREHNFLCSDHPNSTVVLWPQSYFQTADRADPLPNGLFRLPDPSGTEHCTSWSLFTLDANSSNDVWPNQQQFEKRIDSFGVAGLPVSALSESTTSDQYEGIIRERLLTTTGAPCFDMSIGEHFKIAPQGLTTAATDDALWQTISDTSTTRPPSPSDHPTYSSILGTIEHNISVNLVARDDGRIRTENFPNDPGPGMCLSHRANLTEPSLIYLLGKSNWDGFASQLQVSSGITDQTPVWTIKIPVISPVAGTHFCEGVSGATTDPEINPNEEYEIVGFVSATIYDSDIGPRTTSENTPQFTSGTCNAIRARIDCNNTFIPTSNNTAPLRTPRLVR